MGMGMIFEVREYVEGRRSPFGEWFERLDPATAARVDRCIGWKPGTSERQKRCAAD